MRTQVCNGMKALLSLKLELFKTLNSVFLSLQSFETQSLKWTLLSRFEEMHIFNDIAYFKDTKKFSRK